MDGFKELQEELSSYLKKVENPDPILEKGAKEYVKDLLKLPKPKSKFNSSGYTHLVETFSYQKSKYKKHEIEVGWGKYYGRMVEKGTKLMRKQPHLEPTFYSNQEKYYQIMINDFSN